MQHKQEPINENQLNKTHRTRTKRRKRLVDDNYSESFESFWNAFPAIGKIKKPRAWEAWQVAITTTSPETIITAASEFALSEVAKSKYCPGPEPWLNQKRWLDDRSSWNRSRSRNSNGSSSRIKPSSIFDPDARSKDPTHGRMD